MFVCVCSCLCNECFYVCGGCYEVGVRGFWVDAVMGFLGIEYLKLA